MEDKKKYVMIISRNKWIRCRLNIFNRMTMKGTLTRETECKVK